MPCSTPEQPFANDRPSLASAQVVTARSRRTAALRLVGRRRGGEGRCVEAAEAQAALHVEPRRRRDEPEIGAVAGPVAIAGVLDQAGAPRIVVNVRDERGRLLLGADQQGFAIEEARNVVRESVRVVDACLSRHEPVVGIACSTPVGCWLPPLILYSDPRSVALSITTRA